MTAQFTGNWSFSWLMKYESCALMFKLGKIDKLPQPPREPDNPLERGNRVHNRHELYVKGESDEYDTEAKKGEVFRPYIDHLRDLYASGMATAEQDWLFDTNWDVTVKNDEEHPVWLWSKLDVCVTDEDNAHVIPIDYKTGKSLYKQIEHIQQLQLYAAIAAIKYPWAEKITTELWYLDEGHVKSSTYTHDEAMRFVGRFDARAQRIYNDRFFRANPNTMTCAYCPYGPRRGTGACPVGV